MFDRVLVAVDGRAGGHDALALGARLRSRDGRLVLGAVYPPPEWVWEGGEPGQHLADRRRALAALETVRRDAGVEAELRCVESMTVGRGLHRLASELESDLLVVGSSRRGPIGRVLLGDDTLAALDGAPCALAIAPAGYAGRAHEISRIGVGYDGRPESEDAVSVARTLAADTGARLAAFAAVSVPALAVMGGQAPVGETIDEMLDTARESLTSLADAEPVVEYGASGPALARFSAAVDLLVLGAQRRGRLGRRGHGGTVRHLARTARCPLLVLAPDAGQSGRRRSDASHLGVQP